MHPTPHSGHTTTARLLRWIEALVLLVGIAMALMGCQSGAATGDTIGKGVGAWWSTISGEEADAARGKAMGAAIGYRVDTTIARIADRQPPQAPATGYAW